jgi:hypothetical protein
VRNLRWPVTEEVIHQVFDAYGAGNKIIFEGKRAGVLPYQLSGRIEFSYKLERN